MASIKSGVYKRFYLERGHFSTTSERKERSIYSKYYGTHFNKILFLGLLTFALVPIPKLPFYLKHYRKFFLNVNSKNVAEFQQELKTMFVHEDSGPIQVYGTKLCLGAAATYNGALIVASTDCSWKFTFKPFGDPGYFVIQHVQSGKCFHPSNGFHAYNAQHIVLWNGCSFKQVTYINLKCY